MLYASEIFIRFSAPILNCCEEWLTESAWGDWDEV